MIKGKLNIPTKPTTNSTPPAGNATAGNKPRLNIPTPPPPPSAAQGGAYTTSPPQGRPPSIMIAVPAMEMVNA